VRAAPTSDSSSITPGRIGFGCYRVDDETPGHREALVAALDAGCTLIDTSTNYTDGRSSGRCWASSRRAIRNAARA
jgi:aryl-alcohol dehydrogenase-like predicted oxidoreductase